MFRAVSGFARANPETRRPLKPAAFAAGSSRLIVEDAQLQELMFRCGFGIRSREPRNAKTPEAGRVRGLVVATDRGGTLVVWLNDIDSAPGPLRSLEAVTNRFRFAP